MPIVFASRAARLASALLPLYEMRSLAWTLGNVLAKDSGEGKDPTCTQNEEDWSTRRQAMVVITFVAPNRTRKISEIHRGLVADFAVWQSDRHGSPRSHKPHSVSKDGSEVESQVLGPRVPCLGSS